jgi:antitoxin ParD1/3/4
MAAGYGALTAGATLAKFAKNDRFRAKEIDMATMNISLPDQMKEWIERQVETGRYANVSDFVRDLIREDQDRVAAIGELRKIVEEADASGISDLTIADIRREVLQELGADDADAA